jgi:hypothetical protein
VRHHLSARAHASPPHTGVASFRACGKADNPGEADSTPPPPNGRFQRPGWGAPICPTCGRPGSQRELSQPRQPSNVSQRSSCPSRSLRSADRLTTPRAVVPVRLRRPVPVPAGTDVACCRAARFGCWPADPGTDPAHRFRPLRFSLRRWGQRTGPKTVLTHRAGPFRRAAPQTGRRTLPRRSSGPVQQTGP